MRRAGGATDPADDAPVVPYFDGERTPNLPDADGHGVRAPPTSTSPRNSWRSPPTTACCAGCCTASRRFRDVGATIGGADFLVGGGVPWWPCTGNGAPTSRRPSDRCPRHRSETVATGAAVQAAAIACGGSAADVVERWRLGEGIDVAPRPGVDGSACRAAYAAALTGMTETRSEAMMGS